MLEFSTHVFEPLFQTLAVLNELFDQIQIAVNPGGLVRSLTQTAVIGLEDVQVQGGEQGQFTFGNTCIQLGLCPVQISLNFLLQILQDGEIFSVYAMLGQLSVITGNKFVGLVELFIEGFFTPVQDDFQHVDAAQVRLDLVIGFAGAAIDAGGGIGIIGIPDKVGHYGLELTAGNQRVTADFSILFEHQHGVAVLGCLSRGSNTGTAGADHDNINGLFDRFGSGMLNLVGFESIQVGAAGLFSSSVHDFAESAAGEGGTGNTVHTGSVGLKHIGNHDLESVSTHMGGFHGGGDFNSGQGSVRESDLCGNIAVVAVSSSFVLTGSESQFSRSFTGVSQRLADSFQNSFLGGSGTRNSVHTVNGTGSHDGFDQLFNRISTVKAGQRIGFSGIVHIEAGDLTVFNGNSHLHLAAEALGRTGFLFSRSESRHTEDQAEGQEKGNKFLHRVPHPFLCNMNFDR